MQSAVYTHIIISFTIHNLSFDKEYVGSGGLSGESGKAYQGSLSAIGLRLKNVDPHPSAGISINMFKDICVEELMLYPWLPQRDLHRSAAKV